MKKSSKILTASFLAMATLALTMPSSQAGWVLQPGLCPDLIEDRLDRREDRRDRRHYTGPRDIREDRRDRRENRRDRRVTNCPASAFVYVNSGVGLPARPTTVIAIHTAQDGGLYWRAPNGSLHFVIR